MLRNSYRVSGLSRKHPSIRLVTKSESVLCTPRVDMQLMRCLDDHSHSLGLEHIIDCVCDLSRHLFLNLKALRICLDNAGKLANTNHSATWIVGHPGLANDWSHVMLARL